MGYLRGVVLLTAIVTFACAQSQAQQIGDNVGPDQNKQTAPNQQKSSALDKDTEESVLVVKISEPPIQKSPGDSQEKESRDWSSVDAWTFVILVIQSALLWWTIRVMTKSDERALRAWVSFKVQDAKIVSDTPVTFILKFANHGATPALNVGFRAFMKIASPDKNLYLISEPTDWPMQKHRANLFPEMEKDGWGHDGIEVTLGDQFTAAEIASVTGGQHRFYAVVEIEYEDAISKNLRITKETYFSRNGKEGIEFGLLPGRSIVT